MYMVKCKLAYTRFFSEFVDYFNLQLVSARQVRTRMLNQEYVNQTGRCISKRCI